MTTVPEHITKKAKQFVQLEKDVHEKEHELRDLRHVWGSCESSLTKDVLKLLTLDLKIIYTFSAGLLSDREVNAEVYMIEISPEGEVIIIFLKSPSSYLFADQEKVMIKVNLKDLLGTKRGRVEEKESKDAS